MSTDFGDIRHVKARKTHKCAWCAESILTGERHPHFVGKWEGEFQNWRMHAECYEATDRQDLSDGFALYEHKRGHIDG